MEITHNAAKHQFEHHANGDVAVLVHILRDGSIYLMHTEVPPSMGGTGVGNALAAAAFEYAKAEQLSVVVYCPFVAVYVKRHPELQELIQKEQD